MGSNLDQDPSSHFFHEDLTSSIYVILLRDREINDKIKVTTSAVCMYTWIFVLLNFLIQWTVNFSQISFHRQIDIGYLSHDQQIL